MTCSMGVSLDGHIVGPDGEFNWTAPGEEVLGLATDEIREVWPWTAEALRPGRCR